LLLLEQRYGKGMLLNYSGIELAASIVELTCYADAPVLFRYNIMSRLSSSTVKPSLTPTPKKKDSKPLFTEKHSKLFNGFRLPKHLEQKISLIELHQIQ
jgi:hypothetical protein